jgi:IS5 family transposase
MLKVLVLQKFHGLSDDSTEEQIFDRTSFKSFLGLRIGVDTADAKTLWDFKQRIETGGREGGRKLFDAFGQMLEGRGIVAREGSIVNASFVDAPRQRNDRDTNQRIKKGERPEEFDPHPAVGRQKDSEARLDQEEQRSALRVEEAREGRLENQEHLQFHYHTRQCPRQPSL